MTETVTACIPDDTDQPIHIHNPQTNEDQIALPFERVGVDKPGLASLRQGEEISQGFGPEVNQPMKKRQAPGKTTSPKEATSGEEIEQLLTDQGPIYVLTPEDGKVANLLNGKEGDSQDKVEGLHLIL